MSRARDLSNLANQNALSVDSSSFDVGISSSSPDSDLNVGGSIKMDGPSGVITATSYEGSGANLTGIAATDTIAAASLTVSGITTLTGVVKGLSDVRVTGNLNAGITTLSGAVKASATTESTTKDTGAVIVEGGVGIEKNLNVGGMSVHTGISTFSGTVSIGDSVALADNKAIYFGNDEDAALFHNGTNTVMDIQKNSGDFRVVNNTELIAEFNKDGLVELFHDGNCTFQTVAGGINLYHMAGAASTMRMLRSGSVGVGIGVTTTAGRAAAGAAGTVTGQIVYNSTTGKVEYYNNGWYAISVTSGELIDTYTFNHTGANQTFTKPGSMPPAGSFDIFAFGAGGGSGASGGSNAYGGGGGFVAASFPAAAMPGNTFTVVVGEGGHPCDSGDAASSYGGGGVMANAPSPPHASASGGGYAGVFDGPVTQGNAFVIAGGGGGAGYTNTYGGQGGGSTGGEAGAPGGPAQPLTGKGGTPTAGGAVGSPNPDSSLAGSALQGGSVPGANCNAGGGGGGYYGGGAGSVGPQDGGGGGGSAYVHPTAQPCPAPRIPGGATINVGGAGTPGPRTGPTATGNMRYSAGGPNGQSPSPHWSSGIGEAGSTSDSSGGHGLVVIKTYY